MIQDGFKLGGVFRANCYAKGTRELKWAATAHNVVMATGIAKCLDVLFAGDTQVNPWYMGLLASTDVLTTDRLGDISEATEYAEVTRPIFVDARSGLSVTNSGNASTFTIDKDATTVEGAFLCSSNSIGDTVGWILAGAPFTGGVKVGDSGDVVVVTYTMTGADDGV